jgi:Zn finger protein HypA/HybF involved in hydrogenase expression
MMTVKKLRELLNSFMPDARVITPDSDHIVHISNLKDGTVVLSTEKPIGYCKKCGEYVFPTTVEGYVGVCPNCNEDLYGIEIEEIK